MLEGLGKLLTTSCLVVRATKIVKGVKVNDISICNSNEISNVFNEHFSTIRPRLARKIPLTSDEKSIYLKNITENYDKFRFSSTTTSNVFTNLNKLSKTKATGLDWFVSVLILFQARYVICLINLWCPAYFLVTGNVPERLRGLNRTSHLI